jgi:hypothetical protein
VGADAFSVSFELPYKEHVRAVRALIHRHKTTWLGYAFFLGLSVLVGITGAWGILTGRGVTAPGVIIASTGPLLLIVLIYTLPWIIVFQARKDLPVYGGPIVYTLSEDGIHVKTQHSSASYAWTLVRELAQTPGFIFLCLSKQSAFVIPKRALSGEAELWKAIHRWAPQLMSTNIGVRTHAA